VAPNCRPRVPRFINRSTTDGFAVLQTRKIFSFQKAFSLRPEAAPR